jgi:GntR family transcriptional regulator
MLTFQIQSDSEIPASKQLLDQIRFAIASGQYPPGQRLPSTRQLALITGLHRNTISRIYQQLEEDGLVTSQAGSGIYVKAEGNKREEGEQYSQAQKLIKRSIDGLLEQNLSLRQIRELVLGEIEWRLRSGAKVLVTIPHSDLGAGELMRQELEQSLKIPLELITLEKLAEKLTNIQSATVVTSRYFINVAEEIAAPFRIRVLPLDIYDYSQELALVKKLPSASRLGLVSLSQGILNIARILIYSLRGEEISVSSAQTNEKEKLRHLIHTTGTIISDRASHQQLENLIAAEHEQLRRLPTLICSDNYISEKSIELLKRELGLGVEKVLSESP